MVVLRTEVHAAVIAGSLALAAMSYLPGSASRALPSSAGGGTARRPAGAPRVLPHEGAEGFRAAVAIGEAVFLAWDVGPRPAGGAAERAAARHLQRALAQLGYEVTVQGGIPVGHAAMTTANVIGRAPGPPGRPRLVIGAHYDTVAGAAGANDNASGVGVVLEAARVLAGRELPYALQVVFFGGEEESPARDFGYGSRHFVASASNGVIAMVNVDMVGRGEELYAWHCGSEPTYLSSLLARSAKSLGMALHTDGRRVTSDHRAFGAAGIPAVWVQALPDEANHTSRDRPERLSAEALQRAGRLVTHTLATIEAADVRVLEDCCANGTQVAARPGR